MIRDGINLEPKKKQMGKKSNKTRSTIKTMKYKSFCNLLQHVNITKDKIYARQLKDPYALMLIAGVYETVSLPNVPPSTALYDPDITCEHIWKILKENYFPKIETLMKKIGPAGQHYLKQIAAGKNLEGLTMKDTLRELSEVREIDFEDAYGTWIIQPDPEAISFATLSDFTNRDSKTPIQRITPAIGRPIAMMRTTGNRYDVRFPSIIHPDYEYLPSSKRIQIHKWLDEIIIYDKYREKITIDDFFYKKIKEFPDGVFDGVVHEKDLWIQDVICINDFWLHNRPFSERIKYLWHFYPNVPEILTVYNWDDIKDFSVKKFFSKTLPFLIRNLNRQYCPISYDSLISFGLEETVQLKILRGQGKHSFQLKTSDGVMIFEFGTDRISLDEIGKIVDVTKDGRIMKYRFDLIEAQSWREVKDIWRVDEVDCKTIKWRRLDKII